MEKSSPVLCGSISGSIGGLGVIMHNAAYKALGLNYTYVSFQPDNLEGAIKCMRMLGIRGLGVTMPFKVEVIKYLDELDESAKIIGAVNTIVNNRDKLKGYNSDCIGAIKSLEKITTLNDKKVIILGAGGVSKAIVYALKKYTDHIAIYNVNETAGKDLAYRYGAKYAGSPALLNRNIDYDVLINATSVGFKTEETIIKAEQMLESKIVLDVVFTPIETTFVKIARSLGCTAIEGYKMLIYQACCQFELYTGQAAPYEVMEEAVLNKINSKEIKA